MIFALHFFCTFFALTNRFPRVMLYMDRCQAVQTSFLRGAPVVAAGWRRMRGMGVVLHQTPGKRYRGWRHCIRRRAGRSFARERFAETNTAAENVDDTAGPQRLRQCTTSTRWRVIRSGDGQSGTALAFAPAAMSGCTIGRRENLRRLGWGGRTGYPPCK